MSTEVTCDGCNKIIPPGEGSTYAEGDSGIVLDLCSRTCARTEIDRLYEIETGKRRLPFGASNIGTMVDPYRAAAAIREGRSVVPVGATA